MKQNTLKTIKSMLGKTISKTMNYSGCILYIIIVETNNSNEQLEIIDTEILRQYFINHPQSIDKYTFLQNSAFTHWVKEKCSKMC